MENVKSGSSGITRTWTLAQKQELLMNGKVSGFVGHHIKSVNGHKALAGAASNIQFLTKAEHLAAHAGNWRTITEFFYDCGQLLK